MLTLDFEWFSFHVYCELETKTVSNFPLFLSLPTMMSQVIFPTIIRQCSRPLYDYEGWKTFQYLQNASSNWFLKLQNVFSLYLKKHIKEKSVNLGSFYLKRFSIFRRNLQLSYMEGVVFIVTTTSVFTAVTLGIFLRWKSTHNYIVWEKQSDLSDVIIGLIKV